MQNKQIDYFIACQKEAISIVEKSLEFVKSEKNNFRIKIISNVIQHMVNSLRTLELQSIDDFRLFGGPIA